MKIKKKRKKKKKPPGFGPLTKKEMMLAEQSRASGLKDGYERYVKVHVVWQVRVVLQAHGNPSMHTFSEDKTSMGQTLSTLTAYLGLGIGLIALFFAFTLHVFMNEGSAHAVAP